MDARQAHPCPCLCASLPMLGLPNYVDASWAWASIERSMRLVLCASQLCAAMPSVHKDALRTLQAAKMTHHEKRESFASRSASPGKLGEFEEELFRSAEMSETPVVMAVTLAFVEGARMVRPACTTARRHILRHSRRRRRWRSSLQSRHARDAAGFACWRRTTGCMFIFNGPHQGTESCHQSGKSAAC